MSHNNGSEDFTVTKFLDLSLIGSYIVTIRSEINIPLDAAKTQILNMFDQYNFLVIVNPCSFQDYVATAWVVDLHYNIGATALTSGNYEFDEQPLSCGYPETVTLTNLPAFVTHNVSTFDFTIPKTSDLNIVGEYIVNIKSHISVPDNYLKSSFTIHEFNYDFKILIEPCIVNSYSKTVIAGPISYRINDPTLTDGHYTFEEDPVCNYPETVTFVNLPTWVTHNPSTADLTIPKTGDLSLIGEHVVTIKSEILVPTDHTKAIFTPISVTYDFSIFMEPCTVNKLIATPIDKIEYTIGTSSMTTSEYTFTQVPQCNYN